MRWALAIVAIALAAPSATASDEGFCFAGLCVQTRSGTEGAGDCSEGGGSAFAWREAKVGTSALGPRIDAGVSSTCSGQTSPSYSYLRRDQHVGVTVAEGDMAGSYGLHWWSDDATGDGWENHACRMDVRLGVEVGTECVAGPPPALPALP